MITAAVIGLGHPHIYSMIEEFQELGVRIAALCDPANPQNVAEAQKLCPEAQVDFAPERTLARPEVGMVLSSSIFSENSRIACAAIKAGKHVAIDKPLALTRQALEEIRAAVQAHPEARLCLWLTERFNPVLYTAKRVIESGEIGEVTHISLTRPFRLDPENRPAWFFEASQYGGILTDIAVHDIDTARWLCGSDVDQLLGAHTASARYGSYPIEDNGTALFRMKSGATAVVHESWLTPDQFPAHGDVRCSIHGTKGQIQIRQWPEPELWTVSDTNPPRTLELITPEISIAQDFLNAMEDPSYQPRITTRDALASTEAGITAQEAAQK